jgi:methylthioribose-1-phosphate isomerase
MTVLTHCNAGALATGGIGTALAPIYLAAERGLNVRVLTTETRPLLQGSRLTAWELDRAGVDVTVLTDNMAAAAMRELGVDLVIVGADSIAANGTMGSRSTWRLPRPLSISGSPPGTRYLSSSVARRRSGTASDAGPRRTA